MLDKLKKLLTKPIQLNRNEVASMSEGSIATTTHESSFNNYLVTYTKEGRRHTAEYALRKTATFNPTHFILSIGEDPSARPCAIIIESHKVIGEK